MNKEEIVIWKYKHYKWTVVDVIWVALHSETLEEMITYWHEDKVKWQDKNSLWVRPKKMFLENVEINWENIPRFKYIWKK